MPGDEVPLAPHLDDNGNGVDDLPPHDDNGQADLQGSLAHGIGHKLLSGPPAVVPVLAANLAAAVDGLGGGGNVGLRIVGEGQVGVFQQLLNNSAKFASVGASKGAGAKNTTKIRAAMTTATDKVVTRKKDGGVSKPMRGGCHHCGGPHFVRNCED